MAEKRMLLSLAHPDDESFGMGATIARYAAEGVRIDLICATNGEAGIVPAEFMGEYDSIAALRIAELECAAQNLGIRKVHRFNYRDSGMTGAADNAHPDSLCRADLDEVTEKIVAVIRETRPHIVVTFDPYGAYGHPDHIIMHEATVAAYHAAADPGAYPEQLAEGVEPYRPQRLYHTSFNRFTRLSLRLGVIVARLRGQDPTRMGINQDIDLVAVARNRYPTHALVNVRNYMEAGDAASSCHASQLSALGSVAPAWARRLLFGTQTFTQIAPPRQRRGVARDLFDGITV